LIRCLAFAVKSMSKIQPYFEAFRKHIPHFVVHYIAIWIFFKNMLKMILIPVLLVIVVVSI